jgi:hypothetical protein
MKTHVTELLFLAGIALALLFADRHYRLKSILREGFQGGLQMCGVGLPPCPFGTVCGNGFCISTEPPKQPEFSGLPVFP